MSAISVVETVVEEETVVAPARVARIKRKTLKFRTIRPKQRTVYTIKARVAFRLLQSPLGRVPGLRGWLTHHSWDML